MENIVERAIVPRNPSPVSLINKEQYSLYVPIARRGQAGVAQFDDAHFIIENQTVRINTDNIATVSFVAEKIVEVQSQVDSVAQIVENHEQRIADEETKSANHDERLEDIEEYISDMTVEDKSVAYRKLVPIKSRSKANVLSIGGMSYKTKNLVDIGTVTFSQYKLVDVFLPASKKYYVSTLITSDDTDGTTHQIGVAFDDGTMYYLPFKRNTRSKSSIPIFDGKNIVQLTLFAGQNYPTSVGDTATWEDVMICEEDTDVYEPYFAGLRHAKVTEIKSEGANLIPFPYLGTKGAGFNETINGLTWSINADGVIRVVGTSENAPAFRLWENCKVSANAPLAICGYIRYGASSERVDFMCRKTTREGNVISFLSDSGSLGTNNILTAEVNDGETFDYVGIYIAPGRTVDATIYPMLNYGEEALPYKPYVGTLDKLTIPASVQAIDGYGLGIDDTCYNYVDFNTKKFAKPIIELDMGTLDWMLVLSTTSRFVAPLPKAGKPTGSYGVAVNAICSIYPNISQNKLFSNNRGVAIQALVGSNVYVYDADYTDAETFKSAMSGVMLCYELETPIETDISAYLTDEYIEVEGDNVLNVQEGGYLTFENEHKYPVPSNVEWRVASSHRIAFEHSQTIGNPHKTTAAEVGAYSKEEADNKFVLLEEGMVPSRMLPSYVDDVLEYSSRAAFPEYGESGKIYIDLLTNKSYRWSGTTYVELTSSELILGETPETAYRGDRGKIAYDHSQTTGNPHATTLDDILPVTEEDDGKILQVVGGAWSAVSIPNAEGGDF